MPYTPPSARSPAPSHQSSPVHTPGRPHLPRSNSSTTYLSRHRRSPSLPGYQGDYGKSTLNGYDATSSSIRQSPPPVSDRTMPAGAIISPPDSTGNSSDDDSSPRDQRGTQTLQQLHGAVRRSFDGNAYTASSQNTQPAYQGQHKLHLELPMRDSEASLRAFEASTPTEDFPAPIPPRLTAGARNISHSRSATESSFFDLQNSNTSSTQPSDESDEDLPGGGKPPLLRKKSGELVKPAIRPSSRRKHSSMPGTPTYSKAVHFNDDIEQVRHFLQVDRPIAVSAGASPVDGHDEDKEFPFGFQFSQVAEWGIGLKNFPRDSLERMSKPVRIERLYLTPDQKSLIGDVAVANLAFHKQVTARFTLDYWRTTSEVTAEYVQDLKLKPRDDGFDQFTFSIKLSDQANLEDRTLLLCVRYNVGGQELWDNNDSMNFQVDFAKKQKSDKPDLGAGDRSKTTPNGLTVGAGTIPRSRHNSPASKARSRSKPSFEDDFSRGFEVDPSIKFRNSGVKMRGFDEPGRHVVGGAQFSTRYDFGASLSAALSHAQAQLDHRNDSGDMKKQSTASSATAPPAPPSLTLPARTGVAAPSNSQTETPRADNLLASKQDMDSRAYQDFVNKFCFAGSNRLPNQSQRGKDAPSGGNDGAQDEGVSKRSLLPPPISMTPDGSRTPSPMPDSGMTSYGFPFNHEVHSGYMTPTAIKG